MKQWGGEDLVQLRREHPAQLGVELDEGILLGEVPHPAQAGRAAERIDVVIAVGDAGTDDDVADVDAVRQPAREPPDDDGVAVLLENERGGGGAGGDFPRPVPGAGDVRIQFVKIGGFKFGRHDKTDTHGEGSFYFWFTAQC